MKVKVMVPKLLGAEEMPMEIVMGMMIHMRKRTMEERNLAQGRTTFLNTMAR